MTRRGESAPLVLTMGEPAGIGGDVTLGAWTRRASGVAPFFVIDAPERLSSLAAAMELSVPIAEIDEPEQATAVFETALPVLPLGVPVTATPGRPDQTNGPAVMASIEIAVRLAKENRVAAIVTNPIHKGCLHEAGFAYPGHTEYLAALSGPGVEPVMMLACPSLRVVPVTIHLPLRLAVMKLTTAAIVHCGKLAATALARDFGIPKPRLVVAALNPHAGEDGNMGNEEAEVIAPAVRELAARGIAITGPDPADTLFHDRARADCDAVICMYHDQALIPLKIIDFDHGVNITLGLPFIRTSPDHGTALSIAGSGQARETSLLSAIATASQMAQRRRARA